MPSSTIAPTTNRHLIRWVEKMADLCLPERIHWIDGSVEENMWLCDGLVKAGTFTRLSKERWPGCFYARSSANDVARVEDRTFICSLSKDNAGPTNNWEDTFVMRKRLKQLFRGSICRLGGADQRREPGPMTSKSGEDSLMSPSPIPHSLPPTSLLASPAREAIAFRESAD